MVAELIVAPEAEIDIAEAYGWYDRQRLGLGEEFLSCVEACMAAICRSPTSFSVVHQNFRRLLVRRFPYAIFYEHHEGVVKVYCVFHTARDPEKWRDRLVH